MGQEFRELIARLKDEDDWLPPTDDDIRETERFRAQIEEDIAAGRIRLPESRQTPEEFRTTICAGIVTRRLGSLAIDFPEQERELSELATSIGLYSNEPGAESSIRECIRILSEQIGSYDQLDETIARVWRLLADHRLDVIADDFPTCVNRLKKLQPVFSQLADSAANRPILRGCLELLNQPIKTEEQLYEAIARVSGFGAMQGDAAAQYSFGWCYQQGIGVTKPDPEEAVKWYRKPAEQGHPTAQNNLGCCYEQGIGVKEPDPEEAVKWYQKAAAQGEPHAQNNLGCCYQQGIGMKEPDPKEAAKWFREAAEQGEACAQYNLGLCYQHGIGTNEPDPEEALKWYRKAAEQGHPTAQNNLGCCYEQGLGMKKPDPEKAVKWFRKAAEQGDACAQYNLAGWYLCHPTENPNEPIDWYLKAAQQLYAPAEYVLAECYRFGRNVSKDLEQSDYWLRRANEHGCNWTLPMQPPPAERQRPRMSLSTPEHRLVSQFQGAQFSEGHDEPFPQLATQNKDVR